jgi:zinc transport system permease protein
MEQEIYSITLALLAAIIAGLVGSFAVMKRVVLAGDVMSHIALPGLGLAFLFKINPLLGGAATMLLGILIISHLEKKTGLSTETTIGVIFAASVAIGAIITPEVDIIDALFGGFHEPNLIEFVVGSIISLLIIGFIYKFKDKLILTLFSPELATATGLNVNRLNLYFLLIFGLTIMLSLQFLGALLAGALIIIPAAIGRQLTHTLSSFLLTSSIASVLSVILGLLISNFYNLSLGPTIVAISAILFGLSLLKKKV